MSEHETNTDAASDEPTKLCPLKFYTLLQLCDGEACAWWDGNACAIVSLAGALGNLSVNSDHDENRRRCYA